eukprot:c11295_g1_i1.p1 GENE.c11295_g1_i1~~c11295_g1_i1.p1  ORF type:complete len:186 (+),score=32.51 c11295_g1_i1:161-718(+)
MSSSPNQVNCDSGMCRLREFSSSGLATNKLVGSANAKIPPTQSANNSGYTTTASSGSSSGTSGGSNSNFPAVAPIDEEDDITLLMLVQKYGKHWNEIQTHMEGFSAKHLQQRYATLRQAAYDRHSLSHRHSPYHMARSSRTKQSTSGVSTSPCSPPPPLITLTPRSLATLPKFPEVQNVAKSKLL